jgi:membrane protein
MMRHAVKKGLELLSCAARNWNSDNASTTGAALAFFSAFSIAPLLVILLSVAGWIIGEKSAYGEVGSQLNSLFGQSTAVVLLNAAQKSQHVQGIFATAASIVTLLIGATSVLAALSYSLQLIWRSSVLQSAGMGGWLRRRFLSLGFILTLGFLLMVSLTVSTGVSTIRAGIAHSHPALVSLLAALDLAVSLLLVSLLFALIFRYMPARQLPWKVVAAGGVLTAVLFELGRWGVGLYLAHSTEASAFGAAASFVTLLLWLYYTAQIFLFGAEFTVCLGGLRSGGTKPRAPRSPASVPDPSVE